MSIDIVKQLREKTGVSIIQCKKALEEAGGDFDKALLILRKKGSDAASKKSDRALGSSAITAYIHGTGNAGAMVELSSETDFVSKNEEFRALARDIAMHIVAMKPGYVSIEEIPETEKVRVTAFFEEEAVKEGKPENVRAKIVEGKLNNYFKETVLLEQPFVKDPEVTIKDLIHRAVQKFGENIVLARFARFDSTR